MAWLALIVEPGDGLLAAARAVHRRRRRRLDGDPAAQNSVVGAVATDAIGKAAGVNSMMRELGGVFGIAVAVAVFAAAGSYASAPAFTDGFGPAIFVAAAWPSLGAIAGLGAARGADRQPRCTRSEPCPRSNPRAGAEHGGAQTAHTINNESGGHAMRQVMVRYRVKPDRVEENERLVRAVYEELRSDGAHRASLRDFKLDDGVSFVHIASVESEDGDNPLCRVKAFQEFQREIADRTDERPVVTATRADRLIPPHGRADGALSPTMPPPSSNPLVHLELHTGDLPRAGAFYAGLCGWRPEWIARGRRLLSLTRPGPQLRRRHRRVHGAPPHLAPLRGGRRHRRGHRPRGQARGSGAPGPARGPRRMAQRRDHAGGWGDRLLAAEGTGLAWTRRCIPPGRRRR